MAKRSNIPRPTLSQLQNDVYRAFLESGHPLAVSASARDREGKHRDIIALRHEIYRLTELRLLARAGLDVEEQQQNSLAGLNWLPMLEQPDLQQLPLSQATMQMHLALIYTLDTLIEQQLTPSKAAVKPSNRVSAARRADPSQLTLEDARRLLNSPDNNDSRQPHDVSVTLLDWLRQTVRECRARDQEPPAYAKLADGLESAFTKFLAEAYVRDSQGKVQNAPMVDRNDLYGPLVGSLNSALKQFAKTANADSDVQSLEDRRNELVLHTSQYAIRPFLEATDKALDIAPRKHQQER